MAAERITPIDESTGIPLSVAPTLEALDRTDPIAANWHHLYHPRTAPQLQTVGGRALRNSRIQLLPARQHNYGNETYHTVFTGPPLPEAEDQDEQFRLTVLSCAGYIADHVIDLDTDGPSVRPMTPLERTLMRRAPVPNPVSDDSLRSMRAKSNLPDRKLWRSLNRRNERQAMMGYDIVRYGYDPIRAFFTDYLLQPRMIDVRQKTIDQFLMTDDNALRVAIGESLLTRAAEVATDSLHHDYRKFHEAGVLHSMMPCNPHTLAKAKLGNASLRQARVLPLLQRRLAEARQVA